MADSKPNTGLPLKNLRAALLSPRAEKRVDALISSPNAAASVQALSVPDLFYLVNEVGLSDCVELISLCSPAQVQGCIDMEIWDRDQPIIEAFLPWLAVIQENGYEFLAKTWDGLDPELAALTLARTCCIYDKSLGESCPEEEEREYFETPDTFFEIVITTDDEVSTKLVHTIIEDLYRGDMLLARHTLMSARSEPIAELEEMSYRWRSGRMADLGYVDFYEALEVFRPIAPNSVTIGEDKTRRPQDNLYPTSQLPKPVMQPVLDRGFLSQAIALLESEDDRLQIQESLLHLVNRVLAAGNIAPSNAEALTLAATHALATLSLGLEYISSGKLDDAARALESVSLIRLHRLGYTLSLRLARFARLVAPRALAGDTQTLEILEAVLGKRPFFPMHLEGGSGIRPIETLADLSALARYFTMLALRVAIADHLGVNFEKLARKPAPRPSFDDYSRTAVARILVSGSRELETAALTASEIESLVAVLRSEDLRTREELASSALTDALDAAGIVEAREHLGPLVHEWVTALVQQFANVDAEKADPRFVEGLLLDADMS